ncbi:MAG: Glu-tRNA(Gln) amidotransferase subunit GatD [Candidatus Lokiarchaeota archaeon]|nr:Glu-tRNA(Gln) amidotransferase subunit GatD [Candidatus Lokiarchaeota archaeon]
MPSNLPKGYKHISKKFFKEHDIEAWDKVEIKKGNSIFQGIILPRNQFAEDGYIEIKLKNGYNIGIKVQDLDTVRVVGKNPPMKVEFKGVSVPKDRAKPNVTLLGTGGTIASRLDYVTGGVIPAFQPHELYAAVPELADICNLDTKIVFKIFSEDMEPKNWLRLAKEVASLSNKEIDGVVIGHGTDTIGYSTAALSFLVKNLKIPVVFVGSQRSSDRPSSDAAMNLIHATQLAANGDIAEVVLCMLGSSSHTFGYIHRGTRVRKMHSSARDAFKTIGDIPLGKIDHGEITWFKNNLVRKSEVNSDVDTVCSTKIESKCALVHIYPGMSAEIIDFYIDKGYKGMVFAGTGLGHAPNHTFKAIDRATSEDVTVVMALQTLWGFTGMDVYSNGRKLKDLGVIPADMIPETAFAKLCWILGECESKDEIRTLMITNIAGEILPREEIRGYRILQGRTE